MVGKNKLNERWNQTAWLTCHTHMPASVLDVPVYTRQLSRTVLVIIHQQSKSRDNTDLKYQPITLASCLPLLTTNVAQSDFRLKSHA